MAYFTIIGLVLAAFVINIPLLIMQLAQGQLTAVNFLQSLLLTPVLALVGGGLLAGIPVVITGLCMELYRRYVPNVILFLLATMVTGLALEFGYCQLLNIIRIELVYKLLAVMAVVSVLISFYWWRCAYTWFFWEDEGI